MELTWEIAAAAIGIFATLGGIAVRWITCTVKDSVASSDTRAAAANKRMEENQTDIRNDLASLNDVFEKRVDRLEQKAQEFMPRREIIAAVDHEKNNRVQSTDSLKILVDRNTSEIVGLKVELGKLESQHHGLVAQVNEVKEILREQRKESNERLDKIAATMTEISKKVG